MSVERNKNLLEKHISIDGMEYMTIKTLFDNSDNRCQDISKLKNKITQLFIII